MSRRLYIHSEVQTDVFRDYRKRTPAQNGFSGCLWNLSIQSFRQSSLLRLKSILDDITIQSTIYNTIRKCYVKILSRCPPNPSYKGLDCFLSKALVCGLKCYKFISFTDILKILRVSLWFRSFHAEVDNTLFFISQVICYG